jgi:hypothetical protein
MKRKLFLGAVLFLSLNLFAQNLFITSRDYSNTTTIHSIQGINQANGSVNSTYNYQTTFTSSDSPRSLSFNSSSNEIFGISGNIVAKYDITTKSESYITLPPLASMQDYGDIVIANNRLFVTRRDYSNSAAYVHSILEINQTNGSLISTYNYQTSFPSNDSPQSLSFNSSTNEIFGISGSIVAKYNIITKADSSITLPTLDSRQDYDEIVIAKNRLFVTRRDYSNSSATIYSLQEINQTNGSLINTYNYQTAIKNSYCPRSLCYNSSTNEIWGTNYDDYYKLNGNIIKYDITTKAESYITLPTLASKHDYDEIVSTATGTSGINLSNVSNLNISTTNGKAEISGMPQGASVTVYNLQGVAIYNQKATEETISVNLPGRGVYVVKVGTQSLKIMN